MHFFFKFIIENVVFCCSSSHPQAVSYANTAQVLLFCIPSPVIKVFQPSSAPTSTCTDLFLANRKCAKNNRSSHPSLGSNFLGKVVDNLLLSVVFWFLVCLRLVFFFFFFPNITWRKKSCHEKIYLPYLQFLLEKKYSLHCWQLVIFLICEQLTSLILCLEYKLSSTDHQIIPYSSHWHYSQSKNNKKEGNFFFFCAEMFWTAWQTSWYMKYILKT